MAKTTKLVRYTGKEGKSTRTRGPSGPRRPRQTLCEEDRFTGASLQTDLRQLDLLNYCLVTTIRAGKTPWHYTLMACGI